MDRKITVLIVDDDPDVCAAMTLSLERTRRFTVHTAQDGGVGLRLAREIRPDAIILDVMMPGLSGGQVAERLRGFRSTQSIPIIFLTGMMSKAELDALGGEVGGEVFLAKPVGDAELAATIESVVEHRAPCPERGRSC
jgi:DNA-binding response OmpR family regulator